MNESIGGSLLLNIVLIILGCLIAVFTASFAYSKAYRAKKLIINVIEENKNCDFTDETNSCVVEINEQLSNLGYHLDTSKECEDRDKGEYEKVKSISNNNGYCVYKFNNDNNAYYYGVETYMTFDIPVLNFSIPVYGETTTFYNQINSTDDEI